MNGLSDSAPRVLVTKIGLDGHDRGSRIVAAYLRDAGMEVVYTPPWQSVEAVVQLALQEDVDLIGVSSLATDHLILPDLMSALRASGLDHVRVIVGGIVPESERPMLPTQKAMIEKCIPKKLQLPESSRSSRSRLVMRLGQKKLR